ncbi:brp/Blh family beta-carotene 15,15'-monooxygenase [Streptococcus pneumoniae GA60080]|nr:brp/Blh family beta-carotene 15,15'-monooxygenase [Streptococcus pneumoniae GA60080]
MGVSIFLALFYMIPALYFLFRIGKKWELPKKVLILSLLGGMFLSGWLSSFANTYIHDLLGVLFPDSTFGRRTLEIIATCFCFGFDSCAKIKIFVFTWNCFRFGIPND